MYLRYVSLLFSVERDLSTYILSTTIMNASKTIRAVRCHKFAAIEENLAPRKPVLPLRSVLSLDHVPNPSLKEIKRDHVVVETSFAGVQYPDALQAKGLYQVRPGLPYTPGMDVTGVVSKIGKLRHFERLVEVRTNLLITSYLRAFLIHSSLHVCMYLCESINLDKLHKGQDVRNVNIGDRVYATSRKEGGTGGLAEIVVVPESSVWRIPDNVDLSCCANIGRNYFAAYHSLKNIGEVDDRSLVLVDGASGGMYEYE
jgi:threonine dehydrogenase-like Zn-dependent dehydrogenase